MKIIVFTFAMLATLTSFATEKPGNWICDVRYPQRPWPKPSEIAISLTEPLVVTLTRHIQQDDGTYMASTEELITAKTVSKWKADKTRCQIKSGFGKGEFIDNYEFFFACGSIQGSFSIDFRDNTGFYGEQLTSMNVRRGVFFENCRPANPTVDNSPPPPDIYSKTAP